MADLFPAMTRGIGITNGDVKVAERLVSFSTDMVALTPEKTVGVAMEALADAQMGDNDFLSGAFHLHRCRGVSHKGIAK